MKSRHHESNRSFSRLLTLGLLSLPLLAIGACGGGTTSPDDGASLTGGTSTCTGTDCVATGGVVNGTGAAPGSGGVGTTTGGAIGAGGTVVGAGGTVVGAGGSTTETCTDIQAPDHPGEPCQQWKDWNQCNDSWIVEGGYCNETCGRCTSSGSGGTSSGGTSSGGSSSTGGQGGGLTLPNLPDNAKKGWASRYWDCCKPSCAWSGQVDSCGSNGTSVVDKNEGSKCANQGNAYVCNSDAPRAISSTVSYGYVAQPSGSLQCGVCYHLQFTGESHNGTAAPALKGKHMIVKVSNNGGDVSGDQLDLMIPGGGTGVNPNTCPEQWGKSAGDMGAQYGGFRTTCNGDKACIKQKCNTVVPAGTLRDACIWYVDWFEAADNPVFKVEQVTCPSDI